MSDDSVRCHNCGKQVGIEAESCPTCGVSNLGRCECGETTSVYHERCRSCGTTLTPKRYYRRRILLWLALPAALLLVVGLAAWKLFPRDPFADRIESLRTAQNDIGQKRFDSARIRLQNYIDEYDAEAGAYFLLGRAHYGLKQPEEGEKHVLEALRRDPGLRDASLFLAYERFKAQDLRGALEMAHRTLKIPPPHSGAHLLVGRIFMLPGYRDPTEAEKHLTAAVNLGADGLEPWVLLAELTFNRLRFSPSEIADADSARYLREARTRAEATLKNDLESEELSGTYVFLARCDYAVEEFDQARKALETADRLLPLNDDGKLLLAKARWRSGDEEGSRHMMERLLEKSTSVWPLLELQEFARKNMDPAFAADAFDRAKERFPKNPEVTIVQANLHLLSGEPRLGQEVLRRGWAEHPEDARFLLLLADNLAKTPGGAEEAENLLREAAENADPTSTVSLRLVDHLLDFVPPGEAGVNRINEAARLLADADKSAGTAETARSWRRLLAGRLLLARGEFLRALAEFTAVANESTTAPRPHLLLASTQRALGDFEAEAMALSTALRITGPAFEILHQRARSHLDGGRPGLARRDCLAALSLRPGDPGLLRLLAGIHLRRDAFEPRRAVELLRQVAAGEGDGVQVRIDLARAHFAAGEPEKALIEADRARDLAETPGDRLRVADTLFGLARTGASDGATEAALEIVGDLLASNADDVTLRLAVAGVLLNHGDLGRAGELIEEAFTREPENLVARRLLFEFRLDRIPPTAQATEEARQIARETGDLKNGDHLAAYMEGRLALIDEDYSSAVEFLRKAVKGQLGGVGARHFLAVALLARGKVDEARVLAEAVLKDFPGFLQARVLLASIATGEARNALLVGEAANAARILEDAMGLLPGMPSSRLLLARAHFLNSLAGSPDSLERAREECERTVSLWEASERDQDKSKLAHALLLLGDIRYCSRDLEGTIEACRRYRELRPEDPVADVRLSVALLESGNAEGAVEAMDAAIAKAPASFGLLTAKVAVLAGAGRWEEGVRSIRKWIVRRPEDAAARCLAGEMLVRAGKLTEAEASFREAVELKPDALAAISGLYSLMSRSGRWAELDALLSGIGEQSRWTGEIQSLIGQSLLQRDPESPVGREKLENALATGISNSLIKADTYLALILAYSRDRSPGRIVQRWREFREWTGATPTILDADPYSRMTAELHFMGSLAFGELGATDQAEMLLREALKVRADHVPALNNLATLLLGDPMRADECLKLAEQAAKLAPEFPEVLDTLTRALLPAGRVKEALETVTKAISLAEKVRPGDARAALQVTSAKVLLSLDRRDDALRALEAARNLHPEVVETPDYRQTLRLVRSR